MLTISNSNITFSQSITIFKNCVNNSTSCAVTHVLRKYFKVEIVSIGALVRKIPYVLFDLVKKTNAAWDMTISFEKTKERFITNLTCPEHNMKVTFLHNFSDGVKYENTIELHKDGFIERDKWCPEPIQYAKYLIFTKRGNYILKKYYPSNRCRDTYSWSCNRTNLSIISLIKRAILSLLKENKKNNDTVLNMKVLNFTLMKLKHYHSR